MSPLRGGHGATSRARADDTAQEITAVALRLHAALVRAGLVRAGLGLTCRPRQGSSREVR